MVHVDVDNRHPFHAGGAGRGGSDGDVVVETESHRAVALGVVARRTNQRKCRVAGAQRMLGGLNRRAGGQRCNLDRFR